VVTAHFGGTKQDVGYFIRDKIELLNMPSHPQPFPLLFAPSGCLEVED